MVREKMDDWMQDAKELAQAERELKIERWVFITLEYRDEDRTREVLHKIDIPVSMLDRWRWLIEWRQAKLTCLNPRRRVLVYYCYYDKRTGLHMGTNSLLSRVTATKAKITKMEKVIAECVDYMVKNDLFFDAEIDEQLSSIKLELEEKKVNYTMMMNLVKMEVAMRKENPNVFKLFVGYKKLGEFDSILEAKKFADKSGLSGVFNLIGEKYQDSWYEPQKGK